MPCTMDSSAGTQKGLIFNPTLLFMVFLQTCNQKWTPVSYHHYTIVCHYLKQFISQDVIAFLLHQTMY